MRQFLSPRLVREMRLFQLKDDAADPHYTVGGIHDERGYLAVRESLAESYDVGLMDPDIQIIDVDLRGDRVLQIRHLVRDGIHLDERDRDEVLLHTRRLWGYDVSLVGIDAETDAKRYEAKTPSEEKSKKS